MFMQNPTQVDKQVNMYIHIVSQMSYIMETSIPESEDMS